jgi:hypothetical protein
LETLPKYFFKGAAERRKYGLLCPVRKEGGASKHDFFSLPTAIIQVDLTTTGQVQPTLMPGYFGFGRLAQCRMFLSVAPWDREVFPFSKPQLTGCGNYTYELLGGGVLTSPYIPG